jgi:hypothetical protein
MYKTSNGRYEIDENHYFTSGSGIELLNYDDFYELKIWVRTRIEHNGDDYYAVSKPNVPLGNSHARVRV